MNKRLFVTRLRKLMLDSNLSNKQLAMEVEISQSQLSHMLHSKHIPCTDILTRLADFFDVSVDWLIGRDDFLEAHKINTVNQYGENLNKYGVTSNEWKVMFARR